MSEKTTLQPVDIHGKHFNRWGIVLIVLIGSFVSILMETTLATAIPSIMQAYGVSFAKAQTLTTAYMLVNGMTIPLAAYLITRFPSRWLYTSAIGLMFVATVVAAFAPTDNFTILLIARILQAMALGATMPLTQVIFLNVFPPSQRGLGMGLMGIVLILGPAIGPSLSGWLLTGHHNFFGYAFAHDFHAIFMVILPITLIVFLLSMFFLKDVAPNKPVKLDIRSVIESVIGFGTILYAFNNVAAHGWGSLNYFVWPFVIGLLFVAEFDWHQTRMAQPFLDIKLFANSLFLRVILLSALMTAVMLAVEMILPTYFQTVKHLSAFHSGLSLLPGALVMGVIAVTAGLVYDKYGIRVMGTIGFALLLLGTYLLTGIDTQTSNGMVTFFYTIRMAGIALVMMPAYTMAMNSLQPHEETHGTVAQNTFNQLASAMSIAILSSVVANVTKAHMPKNMMASDKVVQATIDGFHASFWVAFGIAVVGLVVLYTIPNKIVGHDE